MKENISGELKRVITYMETRLVEDYPITALTPNYFLLSVLEKTQSMGYKMLNECLSSVNLESIRGGIIELMGSKSLSAIKPNTEIKYDKELTDFFESAEFEMNLLKDKVLTSEHVILSILSNKTENVLKKILNKSGVNYSMFFNKIVTVKVKADVVQVKEDIPVTPFFPKESIYGNNNLDFPLKYEKTENRIELFCKNLNKMAEDGKIDDLVGREIEIEQIIKILARRTKNNIVITGGAGVGKTQLIHGLAKKILDGNTPHSLLNKTILSLDITSMLAGTQFRGVFEERMKGLVDELQSGGDIILFIDDINIILSDKSKIGDVDMSTILDNIMNDGKVQIIGTVSPKEYTNTFERNPSLLRKFQKIVLDPTTIAETINILDNIKKYYEAHHNVTYDKTAIKSCVELANRYLTDRNLPDSAIDLLDEAGASTILDFKEPEDIVSLRVEINKYKKKRKAALKDDDVDGADKLNEIEKDLMLNMIEKEKMFKKTFVKNKKTIKQEDIFKIIAQKTGIPITKIDSDEKKHLLTIDKKLKETVIGQDETIDKICKVIKRNRVGLGNENKPPVIFLAGKSGVGKTLIAKKLAELIFGNENSLIRIDMSEYSDKTSINKIIGANPGYVGYDDGNSIISRIRDKPHSVLLCDEFEKATDEVYNLFLQIFDEGRLTDNKGIVTNFKNTIIILTSNIGAHKASEFNKGIGLTCDSTNKDSVTITKELKKKFSPEIINRFDEIIILNSLTEVNLKDIIKLELNKLSKKLEKQDFKLGDSFLSNGIDIIYDSIKSESNLGARPIIREIQNEFISKIGDLILENDYESKTFEIKKENGSVIIY